MAHAIAKTITPANIPDIKNDLKYPNDVHALQDRTKALEAAVAELQGIVAALA